MVYSGWTTFLKNVRKVGKRIYKYKVYDGNPSGYDYIEDLVQLCKECTEALEEFMQRPWKEKKEEE